MITLDTSAIIAYLSRADSRHQLTVHLITEARGPLVIPVPILAEIAYLVETRRGPTVLAPFLSDIMRGDYLLDCGEQDLPRIRELTARFVDLPLGFADAAVVACAERRGGRVLTHDLRHFPIVAGWAEITVVGEAWSGRADHDNG